MQPVYRESAEDEIKMQKARRDPADAPVPSPAGTPKQEKKAVAVEKKEDKKVEEVKHDQHEERNIDQLVKKLEEAEVAVHILPYTEGDLAAVHNITIDDEPKEPVALAAH